MSYRGRQVVFVLTGLAAEGCSQMRDTSIGPSPEKDMFSCSGLHGLQPVLGSDLQTRHNEPRDQLPPALAATLP